MRTFFINDINTGEGNPLTGRTPRLLFFAGWKSAKGFVTSFASSSAPISPKNKAHRRSSGAPTEGSCSGD